jgi:hypothetical protein
MKTSFCQVHGDLDITRLPAPGSVLARLQRVVDVMRQFLGFPAFNIDSMLLNGG